jgi:hypothetical protein
MRPRAALSPANHKLASLTAVTALLLSAAGVLRAQAKATIDAGASLVRYDGFLLSSAAAVTPTFEWYGRRAALSARGTYLRFESGNRSVQGSVVGWLFAHPSKDWRIETSATAGASSYAEFANFWHLLGEFRLRRDTERGGLWMAATGGQTAFGSGQEVRPVFAASVTALQRRSALVLSLSAGRAFVGDTQYSDIGMTARGQYHKIELEMLVAARVLSEGAGHGVYGEGSGSLPLSDQWSVVISGGRYPSDPIRGNIAGRYLSAALRFRIQPSTRTIAPLPVHRSGANGGDDPPPSTQLTLARQSSNAVRLVLQTPPASQVEIAGDFTDWRPVTMTPASGGRWEVVLPITSGVHQINLRLDGGPWTVPGGTTRLAGDYGDEVGTFVVP